MEGLKAEGYAGQNPGSISSFAEGHPEITPGKIIIEYTKHLASYREALAETLGVSIAELHENGLPAQYTGHVQSQ